MHDSNEVPNVLQYGYSIPPGQKAFATLTKRSYELVTQPWGQCDDEPKKLKYFTNYTIDGCLTGLLACIRLLLFIDLFCLQGT